MTSLVRKIVELHERFDNNGLLHAFGGALALAWCTSEPRGTSAVEVNVFGEIRHADRVLTAINDVIDASSIDRDALLRDGQVRLWWDVTPIDLFLNNTAFHDDIALRIRHHDFAGISVPFLSCDDLAVFKAFFNRPKDWVDIEAMVAARALRAGHVTDTLARLLGAGDERVARLRAISLDWPAVTVKPSNAAMSSSDSPAGIVPTRRRIRRIHDPTTQTGVKGKNGSIAGGLP